MAHSTVFHMRHKILSCVERAMLNTPGMLDGVCEAGLSDEYICVCTSVDTDNHCMTAAVNRAAPSNADIERVFGDKVTADTVILCDGSKRYDVLEDKCTVAHIKRVNKANGFHKISAYSRNLRPCARIVSMLHNVRGLCLRAFLRLGGGGIPHNSEKRQGRETHGLPYGRARKVKRMDDYTSIFDG